MHQVGYRAPELCAQERGRVWNPKKADVWSLGIILFVLLVGGPPFTIADKRDKRFQIVFTGQIRKLLRAWGKDRSVSEDASDLISNMLSPLERRFTVEQVCAHRWMQPSLCLSRWI